MNQHSIPDTQTEASVVAALALAGQSPIHFTQTAAAGFLVFPDKTIRSLEALADAPRRKRGCVDLVETSSFINYVNAHKATGTTHVFGVVSETGGAFEAVLDGHETNAAAAGWCEHIAHLALETTPEWTRWLGNNGRLMTQEAFAEFIEENLGDIVQPDGAVILDVAQLLQGKKTVDFRSGKNLRNGAIAFEYIETVVTNGVANKTADSLEVPDTFTLGLVPFAGAAGIELKARLRFRIGEGGRLSFAYVLDRPFEVVRKAFLLAREEIEEKTGLPVLLGSFAPYSFKMPF